MGVGAGDDLIPDGNAAVAGEGALLHAGQLLQRRSGGDHLEHGAGGVQTGQEPVQIHTLIVAVVVADLRRVGGVEGGVGDHAENIAGLMVVHGGHALPAVQRLPRRPAEVGIYGEIYLVTAGEGAGKGVKADEPGLERLQCRGGDVPQLIPHGVEGGLPQGAVLVIDAGGAVIEDGAVAVQHLTGADHAVGVGMTVGGEGGPRLPPEGVAQAEQRQPQPQQYDQQQEQDGAEFHLLHRASSFPKMSSVATPSSSRKPVACGGLTAGAGALGAALADTGGGAAACK